MREFIYIWYILSCLFLTGLATEVTTANVNTYFQRSGDFLSNKKYDITNILGDVFKNIPFDCSLIEIIGCPNLKILPENLFNAGTVFKNLTYVNISNNGLTEIPGTIFSGISNLTVVDLSACNLTNVPPNLFQSNTNIKAVDLSRNRLTNLPSDLFKNHKLLYALELKYNQLTSLPAQLFNTSGVIYVNLEGNKLTHIQYNLFKNINITDSHLQFPNNYLMCLPKIFLKAKTQLLNISGNCFDELSPICVKFDCSSNRKPDDCKKYVDEVDETKCQQQSDEDDMGKVFKLNIGLIILSVLLVSVAIAFVSTAFGFTIFAFKKGWFGSQSQQAVNESNG